MEQMEQLERCDSGSVDVDESVRAVVSHREFAVEIRLIRQSHVVADCLQTFLQILRQVG